MPAAPVAADIDAHAASGAARRDSRRSGRKRLLSSHNVGNCYLDHVSALIPEVTG